MSDVTGTVHLECAGMLLHVLHVRCYSWPYTYIFMVPFGPKFVFRTSCNPLAAVIFTCKAAAALATSALGFNVLIADIFRFEHSLVTSLVPV